jgi:hypothetical protein
VEKKLEKKKVDDFFFSIRFLFFFFSLLPLPTPRGLRGSNTADHLSPSLSLPLLPLLSLSPARCVVVVVSFLDEDDDHGSDGSAFTARERGRESCSLDSTDAGREILPIVVAAS